MVCRIYDPPRGQKFRVSQHLFPTYSLPQRPFSVAEPKFASSNRSLEKAVAAAFCSAVRQNGATNRREITRL
jgi:hypothetical protein